MNNLQGNYEADKNLVTKVLAGDAQSFDLIIQSTRILIARIVFKMVRNAEDRKDIAQDIYLKAYNNLGGFAFQSKLSTWIASIAYNTCLNYLAKKKLILPGNMELSDDSMDETNMPRGSASPDNRSSGTEEKMLQKELAGILNTMQEKLPPVYQTLITLYHHEGMSYDEMGEITGLPQGTVKNYLFRARKMMKLHLLEQYKREEL